MDKLLSLLQELSESLQELRELARGDVLDKEYFVYTLDRVFSAQLELNDALNEVPIDALELLHYVTE